MSSPRSFRWLDRIKAVAILGIFLNHVAEMLFGSPWIANPCSTWPALAVRVEQLRPLAAEGLGRLPLDVLRYAGWFGEQGVSLFLIVSGFGLTWGLLSRGAPDALPFADFCRRRAARIYPLWWAAHLLFLATGVLTGWGLSPTDSSTILSFLGIRITPEQLYVFSPAWWYIPLLIQLYLVFPALWRALHRWGPGRMLVVVGGISIVVRAAGLLAFDGYLEAWSRGAIFVTRLPEFALGIALAAWWRRSPERAARLLRGPAAARAAAGTWIAGSVLSLSLLGMAVAPLLLGAGLFGMLLAIPDRRAEAPARRNDPVVWTGRHSYSLYLAHHPFVLALVPTGLAAGSARTALGVALAAGLTFAVAIGLERIVDRGSAIRRRWIASVGPWRTAGRALALGALVGVLPLAAELGLRRFDPREPPELGWGERPSLEAHPEFGWRLRPGRTTRLRWESYDYTLVANSLGFPGPEPAANRDPAVLRVLAVGDAFTSAEGVEPDEAWPRRLAAEWEVRRPDHPIEVLNFGITGYGPNQYAAVVEHFAPVHRPDVVIVALFANDFQDALVSDDDFRRSIGFHLPAPDGWSGKLRLAHLRRAVEVGVVEPIKERLRGRPGRVGYFLGYFASLERGRADVCGPGREAVARRLAEIRAVADRIGARVLLAMIPAPVQIAGPDRLAYFPRGVDLSDSARWDLDQPQRLAEEIAADLGVAYLDLRPALADGPGRGAYHRRNSHWTAAGHRAAAARIAEALDSAVRDEALGRSRDRGS